AAQDLPTTATAIETAATYAADNVGLASFGTATSCGTNARCYAADGWTLTVTSPYQGSASQINVKVCTSVPSAFGRLVGVSRLHTCALASARVTTARVGADILVTAPSGDN